MKILRAFKTELDLNNVQRTHCAQHAGAARYAYNWGLARAYSGEFDQLFRLMPITHSGRWRSPVPGMAIA